MSKHFRVHRAPYSVCSSALQTNIPTTDTQQVAWHQTEIATVSTGSSHIFDIFQNILKDLFSDAVIADDLHSRYSMHV